jgi:hypothetical protein
MTSNESDLVDQIDLATNQLKAKHGYSAVTILVGGDTTHTMSGIQPQHTKLVRELLEQEIDTIRLNTAIDLLDNKHVLVGAAGIRDLDLPCTEFIPGKPEGKCMGDGHALCEECTEKEVEDDE